MDDNGVDIMEQSVELARNGYQLQYVMSADFGWNCRCCVPQSGDKGESKWRL